MVLRLGVVVVNMKVPKDCGGLGSISVVFLTGSLH